MANLLFKPYSLGGIELASRVVMAPLTRLRATGHQANGLMATYYGQRAGAGLIISEGTSPSPNGLGYPRMPACYTQQQAEGWKSVTESVHEAGGFIFLQVMHCGRVGHPANKPLGSEVIAPSSVPMSDKKLYVDQAGMKLPLPLARAMTIDDIKRAIEAYADCAKLAIQAGFDGVELHGANGYLIDQFINPASNKRDDDYGGDIPGRLRFLREVSEATVATIGADRVGLRLSPYGALNDMESRFDTVDQTFEAAAKLAEDTGLVYLHLADHSASSRATMPDKIKERMRAVYTQTLILCGNYDAQRAEQDLQKGRADLIAFGRPFIANPDLVDRMKKGAELNEPDVDTFYTSGAKGYTDYPSL